MRLPPYITPSIEREFVRKNEMTTMTTPDENGVHVRRKTFGWLRKKTHTFGLPSYADRFCTIDFEAKNFYYSLDEFMLPAGKPTHFSDILGVVPLPTPQEDEDEQERIRRSSWKSSRAQAQAKNRAAERTGVGICKSWESYLPRLPRLGNDVQKKYGFILQTTVSRIEFMCTSYAQVEDWIAAIRGAVSLCKDNVIRSELRLHGACETFSWLRRKKESDLSCSFSEHVREQKEKSDVDSEQSTGIPSKSSTKSEPSDESAELFELEEDVDLPAPSCKVRLSTMMKPGRWFRSADEDSDSVDSPYHIIGPAAADKGAADWTRREETKRNVNFGPLPGSKSISLRDRLLACGKGPLPRDIKIP